MPSLADCFPLPYVCQHSAYAGEATDDHGNTVVDDHGNVVTTWLEPTSVACFSYPQVSNRDTGDESTSNEQASIDLVLVVDIAVQVDQRDRFMVKGRPFEVIGLPKDYEQNPYLYTPNRQLLELKWVG